MAEPRWPVAERWFERIEVEDGVSLIREPHVDPLVRCNIWHVRGRDRDLLVDTGMGLASLRGAFRELSERRVVTVATHTHVDHVGGLAEFDECVVHRLEAGGVPAIPVTLRGGDYPKRVRDGIVDAGYGVREWLITAVPRAGFDPLAYALPPLAPTWLVDEGDVLDLGDRAFEVLHLPGHSPGSLGLWHESSGTMFSGDAVYDGPLLATLPGSDLAAYRRTMERLLELPVRLVHAGHDPSFGRDRLREIARAFLSSHR